jgi:hypothetical protein
MSKALAIIGNGLGNLIEQTAVPLAATRIYSQVDIWTPCSSVGISCVLDGIPRVSTIFSVSQLPVERYDVVYTNWLMGNYHEKLNAGRVVRIPQPTASNTIDEARYCLRFSGFDVTAAQPYCAYVPTTGTLQGTPRIAICSGSKTGQWRIKRYPYFQAVVANLATALPDAFFYLLGVAEDDPVTHERLIDLRSTHSLLETCGIIKACDLMIANDTGLAHAAAALGIPTLIIFGPTQIAKNLPAGAAAIYANLTCQPCQFASRQLGIYPGTQQRCTTECLTTLKAADVANMALQLLEN